MRSFKLVFFVLSFLIVFVISSTSVLAFEETSIIKENSNSQGSSTTDEIPLVIPDISANEIIDYQEQTYIEVQKIRLAVEILIYGAFPVCVSVLILIKLLSFFGRHYA